MIMKEIIGRHVKYKKWAVPLSKEAFPVFPGISEDTEISNAFMLESGVCTLNGELRKFEVIKFYLK
jgi:hypothetical protein